MPLLILLLRLSLLSTLQHFDDLEPTMAVRKKSQRKKKLQKKIDQKPKPSSPKQSSKPTQTSTQRSLSSCQLYQAGPKERSGERDERGHPLRRGENRICRKKPRRKVPTYQSCSSSLRHLRCLEQLKETKQAHLEKETISTQTLALCAQGANKTSRCKGKEVTMQLMPALLSAALWHPATNQQRIANVEKRSELRCALKPGIKLVISEI